MTGTNSAGHSADLSANLSATHTDLFGKEYQELRGLVPTSADLRTEPTAHARAQSVVAKGAALVGTGGTGGAADPAAAWRDRKARRQAWEAWEMSGGTLDTLPAGLVSASLDAAMKREPGPQRWRR